MKSIKVCEYSRSRSFHDDLMLQDQASGERSQDQWSSGCGYSLFNFWSNFLSNLFNMFVYLYCNFTSQSTISQTSQDAESNKGNLTYLFRVWKVELFHDFGKFLFAFC